MDVDGAGLGNTDDSQTSWPAGRSHHTWWWIRQTCPDQLQLGYLNDPILVCQPLLEELR